MAKGNPFGNKGGRWMSSAKLRALFKAGLTFDEIAQANERSEGWRPDRSVVKRKYDAMGMPPRNASHKDLIPWHIKPEHNESIYRYMLQAESRRRQRKAPADPERDRRLLDLMHEELFGRGGLKVIGYHEDIGFYTTRREDYDDDIIRRPRTQPYADAGVDGPDARPPRKSEEPTVGVPAAVFSDASSQRRTSGTG